MRWTVIRGASLQSVPWQNGRGTSRSVVTRLGRDGHLLWKVAVAELVADAPFSTYPHCDRIFIPIAGDPPVSLAFGTAAPEPCALLVPKPFAGETAARCTVPVPGQAFNVIADRRHERPEVSVLRLEAGDPVDAPDAPEVIIHCVSGELAVAGELLGPGDSLLGRGPASPGAAAQDSIAILVAMHPVA